MIPATRTKVWLLCAVLAASACGGATGAGGTGGSSLGGTSSAAAGAGGGGSSLGGTSGAVGAIGGAAVAGSGGHAGAGAGDGALAGSGGGSAGQGGGTAGAGGRPLGGASGTGPTGGSAGGSAGSGDVGGLDPAGVLPAPTAALPAGTWTDRSPCRPPQPYGFGKLAHDGQGGLWAVDITNGEMDLWQWDPAVRHFWNRTPCTVDDSWPQLEDGVLGYDPVGDRFVVAKYGAIPGDPTTWFGHLQGNGATWTDAASPIDVGDPEVTELVFDPHRQSLFLTAPPFYELPSGSTVWSSSIAAPLSLFPPSEGPVGYDPERATFVMVLRNDGPATWEFSLAQQTWSVRSTETVPADGAAALWWTPDTGILSMLALRESQQAAGSWDLSVWDWDPAPGTWSPIEPSSASSVPTGVTGVYPLSFDSVQKRLVVWLQLSGDVQLWAWDGTSRTWTRLSPDRWPWLWPQMMESLQSVYDTVRQRDLFVGTAFQKDLVLLDWDGVAPVFTDRHVSPDQPWPKNLQHVTAAFDRHRGKLMICGDPNPGAFSELWEWDVTTSTWTNLTPAAAPANWPSCGSAHMVYDAGRRRIVVGSDGFLASTVTELDPQTGAWQAPAPPPDVVAGALARCSTAMVYDERRQRIVVATGTGTVAEWDGSSWTLPVNAGAGGCPDSAPSLVGGTYDPRRGQVVLLTGPDSSDARQQHFWTWDGSKLVDATAPSYISQGIAGLTLVDDLARGNLMVTGTSSTSSTSTWGGFLQVWEGALP